MTTTNMSNDIPSSSTTPVLAMTKSNWIATQHYDDISSWDWPTCVAFLSLSETSQHKLPGSTLTTAKVRRQVVKRLYHLIEELEHFSSFTATTTEQPRPNNAAIENTLRETISSLSSLLDSTKGSR